MSSGHQRLILKKLWNFLAKSEYKGVGDSRESQRWNPWGKKKKKKLKSSRLKGFWGGAKLKLKRN